MAKPDIFELHGLTDLQKKIDFVEKSYPNESEELLIKMGNQFRKEVKRKTPTRPQGITRKKLINSYRVSKVRGYGKDLYVEFRSTSPHFHLVERGHRIVGSNKQDTGKRVEGKYMVKRTSKEFERELPQEIEKMVDKIVRKLL